MAFDSTEVLVAGSATLYLATQGATVPTGLAAPGTAEWTNVGYVTDDGATFTLSRQTNEIHVWQSLDPIRVITTSFTKSVSMTLRQFEPTAVKYALGGGTSTLGTGTSGGTAYGTYTYPAASENPTRAAILDCIDGSYTVRFYWPSMTVQGDVTVPLNRSDSMTLPISLTSLTSSSQPTIISNAPGWTA
jgi:hypothetical protein